MTATDNKATTGALTTKEEENPIMNGNYAGRQTAQNGHTGNQSTQYRPISNGISSNSSLCTNASHSNISIPLIVNMLRGEILLCIGLAWHNQHWLDSLMSQIWTWLLSNSVFNSVYFETWWATICYTLCLSVPIILSKLRCCDIYKLDRNQNWEKAGIRRICIESIVYCAPLMTLDTFTVKRYAGVSPSIWAAKRTSVVQTTRALPLAPPTFWTLTWQLFISVFLYDAAFYIIHRLLHKQRWLYTHVHAHHHRHGAFHARVTNQLTVAERIVLVLSANEALKLVRAHPLTRTAFVPVFVWLLIENHLGYDLPWGCHRLVPWGIMGGAPAHFRHHTKGECHYQPFFTYLDKGMGWWEQRKESKKKLH